MQQSQGISCLLLVITHTGLSQKGTSYSSDSTFLADLTLFSAAGRYYLYGTTSNPKMEWDTGFLVYTSQGLKNWPVTEGPTLLKHKGLYYLIYSANDFRNPDYPFGFVTRQANWALEEFGRQSIHFPRSFGERGLWA